MANQVGIKTGFDAGRRAVVSRTSQPIVSTLIKEGEILLSVTVVIGGLAAHAKDNISRRKTLRYGVGGTLVALVLGGCGDNSVNDSNSSPNGGPRPNSINSGCGSNCPPAAP